MLMFVLAPDWQKMHLGMNFFSFCLGFFLPNCGLKFFHQCVIRHISSVCENFFRVLKSTNQKLSPT